MASVYTDWKKIKDFSESLQGYVAKVNEELNNLSASTSELRNKWQDSQYSKYVKNQEKAISGIGESLKAMEQQIAFLQEKADIIKKYTEILS